MHKIVIFSGQYIIILVKSVDRGPFLLAVHGVFILRKDVLLHHVQIWLSSRMGCQMVGRESSVGISTRYGLDGQRIESRWGRALTHPSRPAPRPTQPSVQWVPGLSRG
jgi:hypothetical protein